MSRTNISRVPNWACLLLAGALALLADGAAAQITQGICLPGNTARLSSDRCPCTANAECIGTCSGPGGRCAGATTVDPPICDPIGGLSNLSADGCPCTVDGDCAGNCSFGSCAGAGGPGACLAPGNLVNRSPDGCPCTFNGDCIGDCNADTRTCGGVVAAVHDRLPQVDAMALSATILLGQPTRDRAVLANYAASAGNLLFSLHAPLDPICAIRTLADTRPVAAAGTVD